MKRITFLLPVVMCIITSLPAFSQKYKRAEDTVKLNKEYVEVSNDIAELQAKLTVAQNNLPGYESRAGDANSDAQKAAENSSDQASKATNGSVKDARRAKRKAKTAYNEAKDSRSANENVSDQDDKISRLSKQLNKKQHRLSELDSMRAEINAKYAAPVMN